MFGHCEFNPDEIEPREYIARVKSVIADGKAYVVAVIYHSNQSRLLQNHAL